MGELGLNPHSLAKLMGTKQSTIRDLAYGPTKTFRDMVGLAKALQTSPQWLLTGESSPESAPPASDQTIPTAAAVAVEAESRGRNVSAEEKSLAKEQIMRQLIEQKLETDQLPHAAVRAAVDLFNVMEAMKKLAKKV